MKKIIVLVLSLFVMQASQAAVPDIGDNSFFKCVETESDDQPGQCFGDIAWVADKNGLSRDDEIVGIKRARRLLKKAAKFFKKRRRKANKQGDTVAAENFEAQRLNAIQSRQDLSACFFDFFDTCSEGGDDDNGDDNGNNNGDTTSPSLAQACSLVSDPTSFGDINASSSALKKRAKFIVNGAVCSENAAANSPVLKITLDGAQHCTGTLVADTVVLTAAHCVEDGCEGLLSVENSVGSQIIGAASCTAHPDYGNGSQGQENDVALIFLPNSFDGIPIVKVSTQAPSEGVTTAFAGYGRNEEDDTQLRATFNTISNVTTEVVSTRYERGEEDEGTTCNGDSGGPLFFFIDGEWKTVGTLSDGTAADCALPGTSPSTDISRWANLSSQSNQDFIKDNTDGVLD